MTPQTGACGRYGYDRVRYAGCRLSDMDREPDHAHETILQARTDCSRPGTGTSFYSFSLDTSACFLLAPRGVCLGMTMTARDRDITDNDGPAFSSRIRACPMYTRSDNDTVDGHCQLRGRWNQVDTHPRRASSASLDHRFKGENITTGRIREPSSGIRVQAQPKPKESAAKETTANEPEPRITYGHAYRRPDQSACLRPQNHRRTISNALSTRLHRLSFATSTGVRLFDRADSKILGRRQLVWMAGKRGPNATFGRK